jgi:hypothetical protein
VVPVRPERSEAAGRAESKGAARTAIAVVDAHVNSDLTPRILAELRSALRGATDSGLAALLGAPQADVDSALATLAARGSVARRGTRWFVS